MPGRIQVTTLQIRGQRTPYSARFDDVYFAEDSGIDESRYVYLEGTGLRERLATAPPDAAVSVGEIGFGVGLNFLLTLRAFREQAAPGQRLRYFSAEQYPVRREDLVALYALYPELARESGELLARYPLLVPGVHELRFDGGRIVLHLLLGAADEMFARIGTPIDLWYWDGFAPGRNPDAFAEELFRLLAARSAPGARGASFTSAGWVRRGLEAAGFRIEKRDGFGRKRECIRGTFAPALPVGPTDPLPAWFSSSALLLARPGRDRIAVAGAGFAGTAIARRLADRGFDVTVFDPKGVASGASGNKAGLFNVQISRSPNPISRFAMASLARFVREIDELGLPVHRGIVRADTQDRQALENCDYPADFYRLADDGLHLPECGILQPAALCQARLRHERITVRAEGWRPERLGREFDHVVYATGADLARAPGFAHPLLAQLPVRPIRGQVLELAPTPETRRIGETRVHHAYLTPVVPGITGDDSHLLGATYQARDVRADQETVDRDFLLAEARRSWPELAGIDVGHVRGWRVGYRLSTPDKLPLIGPVADPAWLRARYERALKGTRVEGLPPLEAAPGEWCLLGLGSRGITFSSLGADCLASLMTGEPLPIDLDLWPHLHSARFFIRNLRKNAVD